MAGETYPAGVDDLGPPIVIDEGTLARTKMPFPGPVGLQAKEGAGKTGSAASGDQIVSFARQRSYPDAGFVVGAIRR